MVLLVNDETEEEDEEDELDLLFLGSKKGDLSDSGRNGHKMSVENGNSSALDPPGWELLA